MARERLPWFRLYSRDLLGDIGLRSEKPIIRWAWIVLLCIANESPERGYLLKPNGEPIDDNFLQNALGVSFRQCKMIAKWLQNDCKMIAKCTERNCYFVRNWDKYQKDSDSSVERTRRYRDKLKDKSCDVTKKKLVTAPEPEPEPDTNNINIISSSSNDCDVTKNISEEEKYILSRVKESCSDSGHPSLFDFEKDLEYLRKLYLDFPEMDLREIIGENWSEWGKKTLKAKSNIHSQWRNFVKSDQGKKRNYRKSGSEEQWNPQKFFEELERQEQAI